MNKKDLSVSGGLNDRTPSRSTYFTWNNNCLEGATSEQTLTNLDFFQLIHDEYAWFWIFTHSIQVPLTVMAPASTVMWIRSEPGVNFRKDLARSLKKQLAWVHGWASGAARMDLVTRQKRRKHALNRWSTSAACINLCTSSSTAAAVHCARRKTMRSSG